MEKGLQAYKDRCTTLLGKEIPCQKESKLADERFSLNFFDVNTLPEESFENGSIFLTWRLVRTRGMTHKVWLIATSCYCKENTVLSWNSAPMKISHCMRRASWPRSRTACKAHWASHLGMPSCPDHFHQFQGGLPYKWKSFVEVNDKHTQLRMAASKWHVWWIISWVESLIRQHLYTKIRALSRILRNFSFGGCGRWDV